MTVGEAGKKFLNYCKSDGFIIISIATFLLITLVMIARLWDLQITQGERKRELVRASTEITVPQFPRRGRILDRTGAEIAFSVPHITDNYLGQRGVSQTHWRRVYTYNNSAPLIGFLTGNMRQGMQRGGAGIEQAFNTYLAGEAGFSIYRRESSGRHIPRAGRMNQNLRDGYDVHLTIDLNIQTIVDNVLKQFVDSSDARGGMAVVMNPHTGEIYAMSSYPTFNPIQRPAIIPRNRVVAENYEAGSIFKIVTFAAGLNQGLIAPEEMVYLRSGVWEVPNERPILDPPFLRNKQEMRNRLGRDEVDSITFTEAFRFSSNVVSIDIGNRLGNRLFYQYLERFGMGSRTGINLPGEEAGILNHFTQWRARDAMSISFGNAIAITPLQMAVATSAIANGGYILQPQIYRRITDSRGRTVVGANRQRRETRRTVVRRAISERAAEQMRAMMSEVVTDGTARRTAAIDGLDIGGKTGTSRRIEGGRYLDDSHWASFVGITPINRPELVVVVSIEDPRGDNMRFGGQVAAPAVAQIMKNIVASPKVTIGKDIRLYRDTEDTSELTISERQTEVRIFPNFVGLDLREARRLANAHRINIEILGTQGTILSQEPEAGAEIGNFAELVLFTEDIDIQMIMPNFVGINVVDAIEILRQRGITPTFVEPGIGRVRRQYPTVGTFWVEGSACSLFVEQGISDLW